MWIPDDEFAVGILDALDDRTRSLLSPHLYGAPARLEWTRVWQQWRMLEVLRHWLEHQVAAAPPEDPLYQAAEMICHRLGAAGSGLVQRMAEIEATSGQRVSHAS
jgi:hypothetical protein